jgi:hypothetical protein
MAMRNMYRLRDKVANTSHERVFRICDECFRVCHRRCRCLSLARMVHHRPPEHLTEGTQVA